MAQAWRSARRFSIAALVAAFTLMIAVALLGTPDVAVASSRSINGYGQPRGDPARDDPHSPHPRPAPGPPGCRQIAETEASAARLAPGPAAPMPLLARPLA